MNLADNPKYSFSPTPVNALELLMAVLLQIHAGDNLVFIFENSSFNNNYFRCCIGRYVQASMT